VVGFEQRVVVMSLALVLACGGRSRSEHQTATSGGAPGSGGTTGGVMTGGGAASSGGKIAATCSHTTESYLASSTAECQSDGFLCAEGSAIFVDDCGCGCEVTPFHESQGTVFQDRVRDACNGPSGPLALFESPVEQLKLGETAVFVRVERFRGTTVDGWAIDKRTGQVSLAPPWAELKNAQGTVVSGPRTVTIDGVIYSLGENGMLVAYDGSEAKELFELPGYLPEFIVTGAEVFSASYDGALYHARLDPIVLPELVEQRGELDDDDPYPVIVAADQDAVYWTAGPFSDGQVTDGDPSMLYRTCR
jgi:hypothetical protein